MRQALAGLILAIPGAMGAQSALALPKGLAPAAVSPIGSHPSSAIPVEFWCSPGFEPRRGACVATLSRDELFIYDLDDRPRPRFHRRHRRYGLHELY